jgi:hypothetical protein
MRLCTPACISNHAGWTGVFLLLAGAALAGSAEAQDLKVTFLGTGSPQPRMNRVGPSILVEAENRSCYLIADAERPNALSSAK